jgi:perosamine synthetase
MKPIPYGRQTIEDDDIQAVVETMRSDYLTQGPKVREFEAALAARGGVKYCVAYTNGTAALHAAAFAAGIEPDDEVVTSPLTFAASANSVLYRGARPVFADITDDTGNLDPQQAERAITAKTKAIIAVDFAGHPADFKKLAALTKSKGLRLIEDAAHSIGARLDGKPVGALADLTTLSFHPVKTITCGEGGAVLTHSEELYKKLMLFRTHGITRETELLQDAELKDAPWHYEMHELGMNYRIPDMLCALGLSQLGKLDRFISRRRAIVERYNAAFSNNPALQTPQERPGAEAAWHIYPLRFNGLNSTAAKKRLHAAYKAEGVLVNVHYMPLYLHPYYQKLGFPAGQCPKAEDYWRRMFTLPLFPAMTDEEVERVISATHKVVSEVLTHA